MGALNLPSAADIDRLTRRLRTVSTRLEGIEESLDRLQDGVDKLTREAQASDAALVERLGALERQLDQARARGLARVRRDRRGPAARPARAGAARGRRGPAPKPAAQASGSEEEVLVRFDGIMAKKDKDKKKQSKKGSDDPVAALRAAVEGTLKASAEGASATRERTREIVDEIAAAAGRVRHTLEDMRVLDEVKRLRSEVEALASRVASLEIKPRWSAPRSPPPSRPW